LNTPPYHPFWYTPAQFQGRLVIRDDASELTYFQMRVPSEKRLNVGKYIPNEVFLYKNCTFYFKKIWNGYQIVVVLQQQWKLI
jgi:hypothetical protein